MPFRLRYGFATAQRGTTFDELAALWAVADQLPAFEHGWLFDHFAAVPSAERPDTRIFEGWACLAALAARTERLRLGMMTTGNTHRHPAVHAHITSTTDHISHGRVELGIGAGWNVYEHESMGIPLYPPGERVRRLEEAVALMKLLWTAETATFAGRYYQLAEARLEPKPVQRPHPPVIIGGGGEQLMLGVVARQADIWNFGSGDLDLYRHKLGVLREHCAAASRDPATIELSSQVPVDFDTPDETVARAQAIIDLGVTQLIFGLTPPYHASQVERVAAEILPRLTPAPTNNGAAA